ncbi:MAG TPA: hypothetical protein VKE69_01020 [Planctomycetota bacterium]|nr:hypothetical protein [Planctomycetota bacterium]
MPGALRTPTGADVEVVVFPRTRMPQPEQLARFPPRPGLEGKVFPAALARLVPRDATALVVEVRAPSTAAGVAADTAAAAEQAVEAGAPRLRDTFETPSRKVVIETPATLKRLQALARDPLKDARDLLVLSSVVNERESTEVRSFPRELEPESMSRYLERVAEMRERADSLRSAVAAYDAAWSKYRDEHRERTEAWRLAWERYEREHRRYSELHAAAQREAWLWDDRWADGRAPAFPFEEKLPRPEFPRLTPRAAVPVPWVPPTDPEAVREELRRRGAWTADAEEKEVTIHRVTAVLEIYRRDEVASEKIYEVTASASAADSPRAVADAFDALFAASARDVAAALR